MASLAWAALLALGSMGILLAAYTPALGQTPTTYTLTTSASPSGGGSVTGGGTHNAGTNVAVTATPNSGYRFDRWSGDCTGTGACSVTMTEDRSVTAHFVRQYTVSVRAQPARGGTVTGGGTYDVGTRITITATPKPGYRFDLWGGRRPRCSDRTPTGSSCTFTVVGPHYYTARFVPVYTLTVSADPPAGGTVAGGGTYANYGATKVTPTATPNPGWRLVRWSGDGSYDVGDPPGTGSGAYEVAMNADKSVTAHFVRDTHRLSTTAVPADGGTVSGGGTHDSGTVVAVTATPADGYRFERWSDDCTGTGACEVTMTASRAVRAHFVRVHTVTTAAAPSAGGTVTGAGTYATGTRVTITATANSGYRFTGWSGDCSGRGGCSVAMDADRSVTANFVAAPYVLTTTASPAGGGDLLVRRQGEIVNRVASSSAHTPGTVVIVTPSPGPGYVFTSWGGDCTGTDPDACTVTMSQARTVTATFTRTHYVLTTVASPAEGGTVSGGGLFSATASPAATATIMATPASGYRFGSWGGDCTGTGACTPTMDADKAVTANFIRTYELVTSVSPSGAGTLDQASDTVDAGTAISITPTANLGYRFVEWTSDLGGCPARYDPGCAFTISTDVQVIAHFVVAPVHTLTTRASPSAGGTLTGDGSHNAGTNVTVTASPNSGYRFSHWTGACSGSGACSVTMDRARVVVAVFIARYDLTTSVSPSGGGTVSGGGTYDAGTNVTVTATPNTGYRFDRWSGDCTDSGACSVTMTAARSVTAHFVRTYTLTTGATPSAGGSVSGGGTYDAGANVTVTATPNSGYRFDRWTGDCTGSGACSMTMSANRSVTAHFVRTYALITGASPSAGGSVSGGGTYDSGTNVTVTATPNSGYRFDRWGGDCSGTGACTVAMSANRSVTAHFASTSTGVFTVSVRAQPLVGGTVTGGGDYNAGARATITATPESGYRFDAWSGGCGTATSCTFTVNGNRLFIARFVRLNILTVTANPSAGGSVTGGGAYNAGTAVTVTATPNSGYRFDRWEGDCTGTGACSVTMTEDRSVTAHFVRQYTVSVRAQPARGGTVTGAGTYDVGTRITITATPKPGYRFDLWGGRRPRCSDRTPTGATCTLTVVGPHYYTARFLPVYTLTTSADPPAGGTVTGAGTYADYGATRVTPTATPKPGYRFDRWSGDCTGTGTCTVRMNAARSVTAHFVARYTLTTDVSPSAGGTVSAGGAYDTGTDVTVTASPNSGYRFVRWAGDCTGSGACTVTMSADRSVTAVFARRYALTASASPAGGGSVSGGGTYDAGTNVQVTASPNTGYRFDRWSGDCTDSGVCLVTMSAARSVTAQFVRTWTLTAAANDPFEGSVSGGGTYDAGTNVTVTATPNSGYRFARWSGDCTGTGACSVAMTADRSVTAHFVARYTLTTSVSPSAAGTVSAGGAYDAGTDVTVTATPNLGYRFLEWTSDLGGCTGYGACSFTMSNDIAVVAHFVAAPVHTLTARATPSAGGTVTGGGAYNAGTVVDVTATPNGGYRFSHWTGGACSGSGACSVTMDRTRVVAAVFVARYTLTATASPSAGGSVSGAGTYDSGTSVTVTATPNSGYALGLWSGACTGSGACSVSMSGDRSVTAHFVRTYTLTTNASPPAGGSVTGAGTYNAGTIVLFFPTPNPGYAFDRWSGDWSDMSVPPAFGDQVCTGWGACMVRMTADRSVTAHFVRAYTLTATASPAGGGSVSGGGTYNSGASVSVSASANSGYVFERWSGACSGSGACSVSMTADRSVTAHFTPGDHTVYVRAQPLAGGAVAGGGAYASGARATITATAESGYRFQSWSGGCGSSSPCTFRVNGNRLFIARFVRTYTLTASADPSDGGSVSGGGTYDAGTNVTVTATPYPGYRFDRWSGDCTGSGACSVTMSANRSVTAHFTVVAAADPTPAPTPPGGGGSGGGGGGGGGGGSPGRPMIGMAATVRVAGDAPDDASFRFRYTCTEPGGTTLSDTFRAGGAGFALDESFRFLMWAALPCTLTVLDGADAASVSGEINSFPVDPANACVFSLDGDTGDLFEDRSFALGEYTTEVTFAWDMASPAVISLARGFTFITWPGSRVSIGEALGSAAAVTAVYAWDAAAQGWSSWFPGGDDLGVNTLTTFQPDGIYAIAAASAATLRVDAEDVADPRPALSVISLARGFTFTTWRGDAVSIGEALGSAAATAVYTWDAAGQGWLSWFPGGDDLGVNTLTTFRPDGIYAIAAPAASSWRVSADGGGGGTETPTC